MLVRFLASRSAAISAALAAASLMTRGLGAFTALGIVLGTFAALYKIRLSGSFLEALSRSVNSGKKPILFSFFSQMLVVALLLASAIADLRLFAGVAAGLLTVPLVICVNAVTEKTGVTRNNWGIRERGGESLGKSS